MEYQILPLSIDNCKDLIFLYKTVFGTTVTLDTIHKKFDTSYLGKSYFGHLAYFQEHPVAFYGAVPVLMEHNGDYEIAAQCVDVMTLPNHTRKGLFTTLSIYTDKRLKEAGIRFIWSFPNQNSEYGFLNKLDWKYQERIQGYKIKTCSVPIEKFVKNIALAKNIYEKHIKHVFEKYKTSTHIKGSFFQNSSIVSTARNKEYYSYKEFCNNFTIELYNVLFWIKIKNGLLVGDIEILKGGDFNKALSQLKKIATKNGIGKLIFQSSPNTLITSLLDHQADEKFDSWVVGYKNYNSNFPLENLKLTYGDLDSF